MNSRGMKALLGGCVVLAVTLLVACTTPVTQWRVSTPSPCADSTYVQLRRQPLDTLSEREWQRFQSLDRQCEDARAGYGTNHAEHAWFGMGHGVGLGAAIMTAVMVGMMITMR